MCLNTPDTQIYLDTRIHTIAHLEPMDQRRKSRSSIAPFFTTRAIVIAALGFALGLMLISQFDTLKSDFTELERSMVELPLAFARVDETVAQLARDAELAHRKSALVNAAVSDIPIGAPAFGVQTTTPTAPTDMMLTKSAPTEEACNDPPPEATRGMSRSCMVVPQVRPKAP